MEPRTDLVRAALEQRARLYWASTNASTPSHLTARFAPYPLTRGKARRTTRRMAPSIILSPAMAYPSASGDAKCCSREGAFVLERITNITALGGHDDRLSALLARVPAALWRRGGLRSIPGRGALA